MGVAARRHRGDAYVFESKFVFAFKFCLTKVKASEGKKNCLHSCNCLFYCVLNGNSEEVKANEQMM